MKPRTLFVAALAAASFATSALAEDVVRAQDPASVTAYLFEKDIPSKTDVDPYGDPMVMFRRGDQPFLIFFFDCTNNANCVSLRFYSGYETNGSVGADAANMLNQKNRFTTALIDDEDDLVFHMDVLTGDNGMNYNNFGNLLDIFIAAVENGLTEVQ